MKTKFNDIGVKNAPAIVHHQKKVALINKLNQYRNSTPVTACTGRYNNALKKLR